MSTDKRYQCKWCKGTGFVSSGDQCWSCSGRGRYEHPPSSRIATIAVLVAGLLSLGLWWLGGAGQGWGILLHGLAISCSGVAVVSLAIRLRGPEEQGQNGLMLIGTLLAVGGIIFVAIKGIAGVLH